MHVATSRPKMSAPLPLMYGGCKVYETSTSYRVVPKPGVSKYDKQFSFAKTPKAGVWNDVLKFCEKPSIPKSSANYVKI